MNKKRKFRITCMYKLSFVLILGYCAIFSVVTGVANNYARLQQIARLYCDCLWIHSVYCFVSC